MLDVLKPLKDLAILTNELEGFGIRLNKQPPKITVKKRESGGVSAYKVFMSTLRRYEEKGSRLQIAVTNTVPLTNLDHGMIKAVLSEYRMNSCAVSIHQPDATVEDLIDVVEGNR